MGVNLFGGNAARKRWMVMMLMDFPNRMKLENKCKIYLIKI
jgi:hypothetical protein